MAENQFIFGVRNIKIVVKVGHVPAPHRTLWQIKIRKNSFRSYLWIRVDTIY